MKLANIKSIITEDDRDQLLKELAWGLPMSELTAKYHLTEDQISNQRCNNSSLYNLYNEAFKVTPEIAALSYPAVYKIAINLLRDNIVLNPGGRSGFSYRKQYYKDIGECVNLANKILKREGLPLLNVGLRYTLKMI